jgi:alcohol dehydrogenase class IV
VGETFSWPDGERLIRFGEGALADAPQLLGARGFEGYALLTTERAVRDLARGDGGGAGAGSGGGEVPLVAAPASVHHVPAGPVPEAAAAIRGELGGRPLVALGGGRVIDAAKAIAGADGLAVAAIPTTLSGAPMTPFHRMPAGVDEWRLVRPALVVADPLLMASQPMPDLAATAANALAHATEALYGPGRSPVTSMAALRAIDLFESGFGGSGAAPAEPEGGDRLPRAARHDLALAAVLAGYAVGAAGFAVHHAVCQTTVRMLGTPHAETNAAVLPHAARFVAARDAHALQGVAPERIAAVAAHAGVPGLAALGVREEQLAPVAEAVTGHPAIGNTPGGAPSAGEVERLLRAALGPLPASSS